jgi:hypothetical protein
MHDRLQILLAVLKAPREMVRMTLREWDSIIPAARGSRLLSRLATQAQEEGILESLPLEVRWHLEAAITLARHHDASARWGWRLVRDAVPLDGRDLVALKGTAYLLSGLPNGRGRLYNDIDVLVPVERLGETERALASYGWESLPLPAHQEHYYRRWLHEIPAMVHRDSGTRIDVHHNILPAIDRLHVDARLLREAARPAGDASGAYVLCPEDMVLHSAAHLFRRGTYANGLRDLVDLDDLMRWHAAADTDFWRRLADRARKLHLVVPAALALRNAQRFMGTPVPSDVAALSSRWLPLIPLTGALDRLVERAVTPPDLTGHDRGRSVAHWLLAHYPPCLWKKSVIPKLERLARALRG